VTLVVISCAFSFSDTDRDRSSHCYGDNVAERMPELGRWRPERMDPLTRTLLLWETLLLRLLFSSSAKVSITGGTGTADSAAFSLIVSFSVQ
jgi:hypothetical protein